MALLVFAAQMKQLDRVRNTTCPLARDKWIFRRTTKIANIVNPRLSWGTPGLGTRPSIVHCIHDTNRRHLQEAPSALPPLRWRHPTIRQLQPRWVRRTERCQDTTNPVHRRDQSLDVVTSTETERWQNRVHGAAIIAQPTRARQPNLATSPTHTNINRHSQESRLFLRPTYATGPAGVELLFFSLLSSANDQKHSPSSHTGRVSRCGAKSCP